FQKRPLAAGGNQRNRLGLPAGRPVSLQRQRQAVVLPSLKRLQLRRKTQTVVKYVDDIQWVALMVRDLYRSRLVFATLRRHEESRHWVKLDGWDQFASRPEGQWLYGFILKIDDNRPFELPRLPRRL